MVKARGAMAIAEEPAANFARRVIEKYRLTPPIDVKQLVRKYGSLRYADIPFEGADGISVNLKVSGKKPIVIVNSSNPPLRKRFTLAHELGHIVIPWHTGTIIDHVDPNRHESSTEYWEIESEANGFAAELLMPQEWVNKILSAEKDLAKAHSAISDKCETSAHAAALRLSKILPPNIVFASEKRGKVEFSGRTLGTLASTLPVDEDFPSAAYTYCQHYYHQKSGDRIFHWWKLPTGVSLSVKDKRPWRTILHGILEDIDVPAREQERMTLSINGVFGATNGRVKNTKDYCVDTVIAACMQRFKDRQEFLDFSNHPDFEAFIAKRAADLFEK
ncbi:ImmA/IrrE family metallo-endopeptidase [Nitrospira sp. NS4]|uniref:ImmA/IrrE family metallo-endopeptidase n=1 Tax=Nitrospira sp. NS4 TaxID=3414498 RepID=UPI003C2FA4C1